MSDSLSNNELRSLLADWCSGSITRENRLRLDRALCEDADARRLYLQYASVEAELRSLHAGGAWVSETLQSAISDTHDEPSPDPEIFAASRHEPFGVGGISRARLARFSIVASLLGIVAVMVGVGGRIGAFSSITNPSVADSERSDSGASSSGAVVARVTATRNCRWMGESSSIGYGAELVANQTLELSAGLAELTFPSGARLLLEGPAKLHLSADAESVLHEGRLSATLPHGVEYTPVRTERIGVVIAHGRDSAQQFEKGWHFGLSADSRRGEEVHVFRGRVEAVLMAGSIGEASEGELPSVTLCAREAARVRPASTTVAKFFADRDKFVRSISSTGGPQDGLYAYDAFDYPPGPLSNQNGGFGWAGAWADIEAACPPGQLATNLVAAGGLPQAAVRGVGGHAAQVAQQNRIRRALGTSLGGVFDSAELVENQDSQRLVGASGQTVYISFLQRVDRVDDGFYGLELHRGDGNANRVLCVGNGAEGAGYGVTSNFNSYGEANYGRLGEENDQTNLIVVKIEYGSEHRDLVTVYRNPESLAEEGVAQAVARLRGNFAFDRISLGCFDGAKQHSVDELRVGTTYRAVTGGRGLPPATLAMRLAERLADYDPLTSLVKHNGGEDRGTTGFRATTLYYKGY